jgi:hypothetical protein
MDGGIAPPPFDGRDYCGEVELNRWAETRFWPDGKV